MPKAVKSSRVRLNGGARRGQRVFWMVGRVRGEVNDLYVPILPHQVHYSASTEPSIRKIYLFRNKNAGTRCFF